MKSRVIKQSEWASIRPENAAPCFPYVDPDNVDVVVVEDDGGKVVGAMTVLRATHFEGAWIDPAHRNAGVTRAMLRLASSIAMSRGDQWVFGGRETGDENMLGVLHKLNAQHLPMELYAIWVGEDECQQPQ